MRWAALALLVLAANAEARGKGFHIGSVQITRRGEIGGFCGGAASAAGGVDFVQHYNCGRDIVYAVGESARGYRGFNQVLTSSAFFAAYASEFTGSYLFMNGDGSTASGSVALTANGPTTTTGVLIPAGPHGLSYTARRYSSTSIYDSTTASQSGPSGDFSIVALLRPRVFTGSHDVFSQYGGSAGAQSFILRINSSGQTQLLVQDSGGTSVTLTGGTIAARAPNLVVATYQRVGGAANNVANLYANTSTATSSAVMRLANSSASAPFFIGNQNAASNAYVGDVLFLGYTNKVLSQTTVAEMINLATGKVTGSYDELLSYARGSAGTEIAEDNSVVTVFTNKPRIINNGLRNEPSTTALAIRSEEFDNAAWTATNVTVTADSTSSPDVTATADTLAGTSSGGSVETASAFAIAASAASIAIWAKTASGTQAFDLVLRDTTASADKITVTGTATTTAQRFKGSGVVTSGNNHTLRIFPGQSGGQGTIIAWGAVVEALAESTNYVRTEGSTVTRSPDVTTAPTTTWPTSAGEFLVSLRFDAVSPTGQTIVDSRSGTNGISIGIGASGVITYRSGSASSLTAINSQNLSWTLGQTYTVRLVWGAGNLQCYRDSTLLDNGITNGTANMPSAHLTNANIGGTSPATTNGVLLSDLRVLR